MCFVDCPLCERAVAMEPGDDEFECPTCAVVAAVVDDTRRVLARAA